MKFNLKFNLQFFADDSASGGGTSSPTEAAKTKVALGETKLKDKHTGIVKTVTDAKSYVTPALITDDAIYMEGRSFTVMKGDVAELRDYDRTQANDLDSPKITETTYFLDQEKYWGRFIDALDKRDTEGNIDVNYVVARQSAEVVAPYLDNLRFKNIAQNAKEHIAVAAKKEYDAILAVTEKMTDDIAPTNRTLFVSPAFYTKIKQLVIALPQGDNKQQVLGQGVQGKIDGFTVVVVPTKFLQGVEAIAVAGQVCASPLQVNQTKTNSNIPGRFGESVEQLLYTGAFVPEELQKFIYTLGGTAVTPKKDGVDVHQ
ncbi:sugar-binding protein [Staphylococcus pseudintermedius]|nr:sugar-binding protein [Staphylococcus pseudintermedius]